MSYECKITPNECRQCGTKLRDTWSTDICFECSRANIHKIFKKNPELKQAFKETIEELKKPENMENMEKMVEDTVNFMKKLQNK